MIDLIVMPVLLLAVFALVGLAPGFFAFQLDQATITVTNIQAGEALQGIVQIQGTVQAEGFSGYEVSFSYASDTTGTWFLIEQGSEQVQEGLLASWDTSRITDGDYRLRILVTMNDGSVRELVIPDLLVRNYTPFEPTETPPSRMVTGPEVDRGTLEPSLTAPAETQTPPPVNPGSLTEKDFLRMLGCGAGAAVLLFTVLGLFLAISRQARRR
jgi:hypothetical protein